MIEQHGNVCRLSGDITLDTVPRILEQLLPLIQSGVDTLECKEMQNVDSSALGLIFSCRREALKKSQVLKISGLPARLFDLASLYGVADQVKGIPD
jgi:phospholipid transport system transporter-binding protein